MRLRFTVPGEPQPKGRPRVVRNKNTGRIQAYTPRSTINYEHKVGWTAVAAKKQAFHGVTTWPLEALYKVSVVIVFKDERRRKDFDNVLKSIADGCEGVLWANDWRIKRGSWDILEPDAGNPRVEVEVEVL